MLKSINRYPTFLTVLNPHGFVDKNVMPHLEDNGFVRMAKSMEAYVSDIQYINTWKTSQGQKGDMVQTAIPDVNLRRLRTENSSGDGTKGNSQPLNLLLLA